MQGKFPIRSTKYYREQENHSSDQMEAVLLTKNNPERFFNSINEEIISIIPYDCHIFCLHTNPVGIPHFGGDLYEIIDPLRLIEYINNEIHQYWNSIQADFIGTFTCAKIVEYSKEKADPVGPFINIIQNECPPGNIIENMENSIFQKPFEYHNEHEFRIAIIPCYSNSLKDGISFHHPKTIASGINSNEIMCRGTSMENTLRLVNIKNT